MTALWVFLAGMLIGVAVGVTVELVSAWQRRFPVLDQCFAPDADRRRAATLERIGRLR